MDRLYSKQFEESDQHRERKSDDKGSERELYEKK
jgi:hypothetical protein